jgi:hypothetical protein
MVDRATILVSVYTNRTAPEETAIRGSGEHNSLVVVLKAIFTWRLNNAEKFADDRAVGAIEGSVVTPMRYPVSRSFSVAPCGTPSERYCEAISFTFSQQTFQVRKRTGTCANEGRPHDPTHVRSTIRSIDHHHQQNRAERPMPLL